VKRPAALIAAAIALSACGHGSTKPPEGLPTLPPGGAFKDGLIYAAVKARLAGSDIDSTTRISVSVHNGVVTLGGAVKDAATKGREVKLVSAMRGVKSVNDELRVGHVGPSAADVVRNAGLVAAVASSLTAQTGINVTGITVHADASTGTVTLVGHAPTAAVKSTLIAAAHHTPGVRNVVDRIAVK
jgi:osmotically-inducible protein OsmY